MISRLDADGDGAVTLDEMHHRDDGRGDREREGDSGDQDE
jgi:hypothetical protein